MNRFLSLKLSLLAVVQSKRIETLKSLTVLLCKTLSNVIDRGVDRYQSPCEQKMKKRLANI